MNQVGFVLRRQLSWSQNVFGNNRKTGKYKKTTTGTKPLTYEQWYKPQHINRLKTFHSINTTTLQGMGHELHGDGHSANALFEDLFIRKFVKGVFWRQHIPEKGVGVIRRLNEIEVILTLTPVGTCV